MRISTAQLHAQGLAGMLGRQQEIARTQQELITGNKLTRAAQDPAGAASAQRIDHALASLEQFERNSGLVEHRLRLQEGALGDAGDTLTRARELALQGNNASLSDGDRTMLVAELKALQAQMLGIANRDDGNGRQLFAGSRDGVTPFALSAGNVSYAGDDGQNQVDIGPGLSVADTDAGSDVFLRVRAGTGEVRGAADPSNTGRAVLQATSVTDSAQWNGAALRLEFTGPDTYDVLDAGGTVLSSGTYQSGDSIDVGGVTLRITGAPAAGDGFDVQRAPNQDVFTTLQRLTDAMSAPATTDAERARRDNIISESLADIGSAQDHLLRLRADTGARMAAIDAAADTREAGEVSMSDTLSSLRDVDFAEAASKLTLQLTALEAAQSTMMRVQGLSLFDRLR